MKQKKNKKRKPQLPVKKKSKIRISFSSVLGMIIGLALMAIGLYFGIRKGEPGGYFIAVIGFCFCAMILAVFYWRTKHS